MAPEDFENDFVLDLSLPNVKSQVFEDHEFVDSFKPNYKKSLIKRYCKSSLVWSFESLTVKKLECFMFFNWSSCKTCVSMCLVFRNNGKRK